MLKNGMISIFFLVFCIEVQLINNVVLISAVPQSDSVIHIHIHFHILFHHSLLQNIEWACWLAQLIKTLPAKQETPSSIPGSGRSSGEGHGNPLQYSCQVTPHYLRISYTYIHSFSYSFPFWFITGY